MNIGDYLAFQTHSESIRSGKWCLEMIPKIVNKTAGELKWKVFVDKETKNVFYSNVIAKYKASFGWRVKRLKQ